MTPLHDQTAVVFQAYGFDCSQARRLVERLNTDAQADRRLTEQLDGPSPFRVLGSERSVRRRNWVMLNGLARMPSCQVGKSSGPANLSTFPGAQ